MPAETAVKVGVARRRRAAVTAALALSATAVVSVSGTSHADGPLGSLPTVTQPVATAAQPVTQAVGSTTTPVTQAVATTTKPVTQAVATTTKPVTQAVATTTKPVTQAVATTTKPVTQAVATTTKPVTQAVATATKPVTQAVATTTKPITQAVTTAAKPVTQAVATATKPVTQAVATATKPVTQAVATATKPVTQAVATTTKPITQAVATTTKPDHTGRRDRAPSPSRKPSRRPPSASRDDERHHQARHDRYGRRRAASEARGNGDCALLDQRTRGGESQQHVPPAALPVRRPPRTPSHGRGTSTSERSGQEEAAAPTVVPQRARTIANPPTRTITLSPVTLAAATATATTSPAVAPSAPTAAVPTGGGSSNTAFGLLALIGAGGLVLLRARALASAAGIDDAGTLMALGHAGSTFWAGSCFSLGTGGTTAAGTTSAALTTDPLSPLSAVGSRARFGVRGVVSGTARCRRRKGCAAGSLAGSRGRRQRSDRTRDRAVSRVGDHRRRARRDPASRSPSIGAYEPGSRHAGRRSRVARARIRRLRLRGGDRSRSLHDRKQCTPERERNRVHLDGVVTCATCRRFTLGATVSQRTSGAVGQGGVRCVCRSAREHWLLTARAREATRFKPGAARVCVWIIARGSGGEAIDAAQWCESVTLRPAEA